MNLQQLRYLVAAADTGSLSGAARVERVSQPVVSRSLHGLEREFDVQLFRLDGRRLALTDAGAAVVATARRALDAADEVERTARRHSTAAQLVLAATPTNTTLLRSVLSAFLGSQPYTALHLRRARDMQDVVAAVRAGDAELGFGDLASVRPDEGLELVPLWTAEVVVVSPPGTDLPAVVPVTALGTLRFALPEAGSDRRQMIDDLVHGATGRQPAPALVSDERSTWIASAQQGIGSFLSYRAVVSDVAGVDRRALEPPIVIEVGFVHRASGLSPRGRDLLATAGAHTPPLGCEPAAPPISETAAGF
jgi:DNA-binding transcriptional LysR family regulator